MIEWNGMQEPEDRLVNKVKILDYSTSKYIKSKNNGQIVKNIDWIRIK